MSQGSNLQPPGPTLPPLTKAVEWERRVVLIGLTGGLWLSILASGVLTLLGIQVPGALYATGAACLMALVGRLPRMPPANGDLRH